MEKAPRETCPALGLAESKGRDGPCPESQNGHTLPMVLLAQSTAPAGMAALGQDWTAAFGLLQDTLGASGRTLRCSEPTEALKVRAAGWELHWCQ